ncbi:MAG: hypothetical protein C7B43_03920 [Sulfobacillus benefaciens]|uniref:AMP-dependent synthetase/ligase domain-containing protein n=1 Tax=Sulfobacillus benefaciens TaxID=453960 RepID=A0A2T2X985_9FIRM|nr:MAG: hypothetical protein C7B43_03920 [Sulfobacillus benefaciens]
MQPIWKRFWPPGVVDPLDPPQESLAQAVSHWAKVAPNNPALIYYGDVWSYSHLNQLMLKTAGALHALGVEGGDRVMLFCQNTPHFILGFLAAQAVGAVVVTANPMFRAEELRDEIMDSRPKVLLADAAMASVVEEVVSQFAEPVVIYGQVADFLPVDAYPKAHGNMLQGVTIPASRPTFLSWVTQARSLAEPKAVNLGAELALIQYSAGTTAIPKGAMILYRQFLWNVEGFLRWSQVTPNTVHLAVLPLFHVNAMVHSMAAPFMAGASVVLLTGFETQAVIEAIDRYHVTNWAGTAAMNIAVVNFPYLSRCRLDSLTHCTLDGDSIPLPVLERFRELTGVCLVEGYTLSETISQITFNPFHRPKLGSRGIPVHGVDLRISELSDFDEELPLTQQGEVWVRGPQVMAGYWEKPEATRAVLRSDGWFDTGDIGYVDEDGYLYIVGRSKELIKA